MLRDGILVGFVPQIPDSDDLDANAIVTIIAGTDYDAPATESPPAHPTERTASPPRCPRASPRPRGAGRIGFAESRELSGRDGQFWV